MSEPTRGQIVGGYIFAGILGAFVGFLLVVAGCILGDNNTRIEAIKNNAACYTSDENGKPKFTWKCKS
jgi:hypothetical protein